MVLRKAWAATSDFATRGGRKSYDLTVAQNERMSFERDPIWQPVGRHPLCVSSFVRTSVDCRGA